MPDARAPGIGPRREISNEPGFLERRFGESERRRAFEGEPVSYYLSKRGGVPVKERIILYTTRQRQEFG